MYLIYSPIEEKDAKKLATALVKEKLVACVNITAPHTAIYRWKGKIEESKEVVLLCKTSGTQLPKAVAFLKEKHPYETPVVMWWEVGATPETLTWLEGALK